METLVDLRLQSVKIAASLKDVSSECVLDVADKIYRYIKRDAQLPESVSMDEVVRSIANVTTANLPPLPSLDKDLVVCYE